MLRSVETQPLTGRFVFVRFQNLKIRPSPENFPVFWLSPRSHPCPLPGSVGVLRTCECVDPIQVGKRSVKSTHLLGRGRRSTFLHHLRRKSRSVETQPLIGFFLHHFFQTKNFVKVREARAKRLSSIQGTIPPFLTLFPPFLTLLSPFLTRKNLKIAIFSRITSPNFPREIALSHFSSVHRPSLIDFSKFLKNYASKCYETSRVSIWDAKQLFRMGFVMFF